MHYCGDPSPGSSKPRNIWWTCREHLTGPFISQQFIFRCQDHKDIDKKVLKKRFEGQRAAEEKKDDGDQQGGAQQGGAQQGGAQQGGAQQSGAQQDGPQQGTVQERVNNLCVSVGVDSNGSVLNLVAVLETTLYGNAREGTLMVRVAALEALLG